MTLKQAMISIGGPYARFVEYAYKIILSVWIIRIVGEIIIDLM